MFINICLFVYAIGVFGAIIGILDLGKHNYKGVTPRPSWFAIPICLTPGLNYFIMWVCFKEVEIQKNIMKKAYDDHKKRLSQVNHGKGV